MINKPVLFGATMIFLLIYNVAQTVIFLHKTSENRKYSRINNEMIMLNNKQNRINHNLIKIIIEERRGGAF